MYRKQNKNFVNVQRIYINQRMKEGKKVNAEVIKILKEHKDRQQATEKINEKYRQLLKSAIIDPKKSVRPIESERETALFLLEMLHSGKELHRKNLCKMFIYSLSDNSFFMEHLINEYRRSLNEK